MRYGISLTGIPLIALAMLGTVAVLAATILLWGRGLILRATGVLLTEALIMLSVGLVVNRSEQFYPTWTALLHPPSAIGTSYAVTPGELDRSLQARGGAPFTWQPTGWTGWHLAGAPTVVTPAAYLSHPAWRYSTVLILDNGSARWTPVTEAAAARAAGATITVFARTTPATTARTLATALPEALSRDLRATERRWALVATAADARLAQETVVAAPARFAAIAMIRGVRKIQKAPTKKTPAKITLLLAGIRVDSATTLAGALTWAAGQTPPPLAASTPPVTRLPVHHHSRHHPAPGGSHGPRQPRI